MINRFSAKRTSFNFFQTFKIHIRTALVLSQNFQQIVRKQKKYKTRLGARVLLLQSRGVPRGSGYKTPRGFVADLWVRANTSAGGSERQLYSRMIMVTGCTICRDS